MVMKKVLIVDDVAIFRHLISTYLGRRSFDIYTAQTGKEGFEKALKILPDLVILDLVMSGGTGDEVCGILKNDPRTKKIPVIIISSLWGESVKDRCMKAGCDAFLFKPIRQDTLMATVTQQLQMGSRVEKRSNTYMPCTVCHREGEKEAWIHSLSRIGAFLELAEPCLPGDNLQVRFTLPHSQWEVDLETEIVWAGRMGENGPEGVGVKFVNIDHIAEEMISRYVKTQTVLTHTQGSDIKSRTGGTR